MIAALATATLAFAATSDSKATGDEVFHVRGDIYLFKPGTETIKQARGQCGRAEMATVAFRATLHSIPDLKAALNTYATLGVAQEEVKKIAFDAISQEHSMSRGYDRRRQLLLQMYPTPRELWDDVENLYVVKGGIELLAEWPVSLWEMRSSHVVSFTGKPIGGKVLYYTHNRVSDKSVEAEEEPPFSKIEQLALALGNDLTYVFQGVWGELRVVRAKSRSEAIEKVYGTMTQDMAVSIIRGYGLNIEIAVNVE